MTSAACDDAPVRGLALVLLGVAASACLSAAARVEVRSVDRLEVTSVDGRRARVVLAVRLVSQSGGEARVRATSYEVSLAGRPGVVGSGAARPDVHVAPGQEVVLPLPFEVDLAALPPDLPALLGRGGVPYRARVKLSVTSALGELEGEITPEGTADLGPGFAMVVSGVFSGEGARVVGVEPPALDLGAITLRVRVAFAPVLPFPVRVKAASYSVAVDGHALGRAEQSQPFEVAPGKPAEVVLPLRVPLLGLGEAARAALGALAGHQVLVQGEVEIEPIGPIARVPFRVESRL